MSPDPRVLDAFDRLFAAMGVQTPQEKARIVRAVSQSDAMQQRLRALAARLITEVQTP